MKLPRRQFLHLAAGAATLPAVSRSAWAQAYPSRPVTLVVAFPAGGAATIQAQLLGSWLSDRLGQPFVVEHRPGGSTNVGTESVVRAPADGYTLLLASATNAINATLFDKLSFNFVRDTAPVAGIVRTPSAMVVSPSFPAKTVPEFVSHAKDNPDKLRFGSAGNGTLPHVLGELFKMMAGVGLVAASYPGIDPALADLLIGRTEMIFAPLSVVNERIKAGTLRILAVTPAKRLDVLPDIPTVGEFLPGYEGSGWQGIVAPRNTPVEIIDRLNGAINAALADPSIKARLAGFGGTVLGGSPADFGKLIADETEKWAKVIKFAGIKSG